MRSEVGNGDGTRRFPVALRPDVLKPDAEGHEYYRCLRCLVSLAKKSASKTTSFRADASKQFHPCQLAAARVVFEPLFHDI